MGTIQYLPYEFQSCFSPRAVCWVERLCDLCMCARDWRSGGRRGFKYVALYVPLPYSGLCNLPTPVIVTSIRRVFFPLIAQDHY